MTMIAEAPKLIDRLRAFSSVETAMDGAAILPGNRNTALTSIAGRLRRQGADADRIEDALAHVNSGLQQPLPPSEVRSIAGSVSRYEPAPDFTEQGVAKNFAKTVRKGLCYTPAYGWLLFDEKVWEQDRQGLWVQELVKQFIDRLQDGIDADLGLPPEGRAAYSKQIRALRRAAPIASIAKLARSESALIDTDDWPDRPYLLNFQNGTLDLRSMELRPHDPADRLRAVLPYEYDATAEAPNFSRVLNDALDEECAKFVLRAYGYALSGIGTEQKLIVLVGSGRNGKSTLAEAARHVFGSYATTANPETFMRQQNKPAINNDIAALSGVRLVTTSELSADQRLDAALVKRMTGGERLKARFLHKEYFEFDFNAAIVMVSNFSPLFDASDMGIARRLLFVPFDKTLSEKMVDENLRDKLRAESPGIMNLLLSGYREYQARGLDVPEAVRRKTDEILKDHNQILRFVEDRCALDPEGHVMARELYNEYGIWCTMEGTRSMGDRAFKAAIERTTSLSQKRAAGGQKWIGLRLKPR